MQLLIILALLLYGGKNGDAGKLLSEVKPVLESIGGDDMRQALKSAEEISGVLNAVKGFSSAPAQDNGDFAAQTAFAGEDGGSKAVNFPLKPISDIVDKDIAYSLSKYISETES